MRRHAISDRCLLKTLILSGTARTASYLLANAFSALAFVYTSCFLVYRLEGEYRYHEISEAGLYKLLSAHLVKPFAEVLYPDYMNNCVMLMALDMTAQRLALVSLSLALFFWGVRRAIDRAKPSG